jgi:hypothetical protein
MSFLKNLLLVLAALSAFSCIDPTTRNDETPAIPETPPTSTTSTIQPDYNYFIQPLPGWNMKDSVNGKSYHRTIYCPVEDLNNFPRGFITIETISTENGDSLVNKRINAMKNAGEKLSVTDQGKMKVHDFDVSWFTYLWELEPGTREVIDYIIPAGEFAYFITFSTGSGSFEKYRARFDKMIKSFRLPSRGQTREFEPKETSASPGYLPTGVYFVTYEGQGIKRKIHQSSQEVWIESKAFASADHISQVNLRYDGDGLDGKALASLNIQFDAKGTEELAAGTGINSQPKIAIVIANKLLYVVDNRSKISTGSLNILMEGFSVKELEGMRSAAANGK